MIQVCTFSRSPLVGRAGRFLRRRQRSSKKDHTSIRIRCLSSSQQQQQLPIQIEKYDSSAAERHRQQQQQQQQHEGLIRRSLIPQDGLTLADFVHPPTQPIQESDVISSSSNNNNNINNGFSNNVHKNNQPLTRTFHIKTYGCQMNVNDSDIVRAILRQHGYQEWQGQYNNDDDNNDEVVIKKNPNQRNKHQNFISTTTTTTTAPSFSPSLSVSVPDIILTNTCAIREKAEEKVWQRLRHLRKHRQPNQIVGVLGCMAERLQSQLLQEDIANLVVGPDQYRQLPQLLDDIVIRQQQQQQQTQKQRHHRPQAINVELSLEETYHDIIPIRDEVSNPFSAFVSIQRGCSNRWYVRQQPTNLVG
jgi:hypothetical protein